jgi:hypothetical protein
MIFGSYRRLSELDARLRERMKWSGTRRVSAISTMRAIEPIVALLGRARPGEAYLVHLMLPHFPHVYDAECAMKPDPATWLDGSDATAAPRNNTEASRRARYPGYLDQLRCTQRLVGRMLDALAAAGVADRATIVVHGDHGSRLDMGPPAGEQARAMRPADYLDAFSTLFAVKLPGATTGGLDRRPLPVERLVAAALRDGALPGPGPAEPPAVWIQLGKPELERRDLPAFADGRPADAW